MSEVPVTADEPVPAGAESAPVPSGFHVHLDVFEGPFDLLLSLIAKRQLDVTLVALAQVTDEFIAYIKLTDGDWDLDQASGFLVVAATLLDLKVARLLPNADEGDEEDLALLEARDLLFARLLQYRRLAQLATSDELVVVYGSDEPRADILVAGLRYRLPRYSIESVDVRPPVTAHEPLAARLGGFVEAGTLAIAVTPTEDLLGVTAELSSYLRADRVLRLSYSPARGADLHEVWTRDNTV